MNYEKLIRMTAIITRPARGSFRFLVVGFIGGCRFAI
jgi:hypothetical protein